MARPVVIEHWLMAQHWTSRMTRKARELSRVYRNSPRIGDFVSEDGRDGDSRRIRNDLDAIRARFPDHA